MLKKVSALFLVLILVFNIIDLQGFASETTLLSQGKACTASSNYADYTPSKATDGDIWEGWLAAPAQSIASIYVDLGSLQSVSRVKIYWGSYDYAISYKIQTSVDSNTWVDVYTTNTGDGGTDDITFTASNARYVRVYCSEKADWSYEIYELQVYGGGSQGGGVAPGIPTGLAAASITSSSAILSWNEVSGATGYKLYRGNTVIYTGSNLSYMDSNLTASSAYTYKVSASNTYGDSEKSTGINITTLSTGSSPIVYHGDNHAYLNSEWFDSTTPFTDNQIKAYVNQLKGFSIKYLFCDIGVWKKNDSTEVHIDESQYADLAHWIKIAKEIDPEIQIIATLNANLKRTHTESYFVNNTSPYAEKAFGTTVKNEVANLVNKLCNTGLLYKDVYYQVDGIHIDFEPFKVMYQKYFSEILTIARNNMAEGQHLSCATPAKNGLWSNAYTTSIVNKVDMINPMIYDCQGPTSWGTVSDGVAQNATEYIKLIKDTCVWLSSMIEASNNTDCQLAPIMPVYEDMGYESSPEEGWPDAESNYIWYHLNTIENMNTALSGVRQAMAAGANIHSSGIFWLPNFIGEQPNKYSDFAADQATWMNEWVYKQ